MKITSNLKISTIFIFLLMNILISETTGTKCELEKLGLKCETELKARLHTRTKYRIQIDETDSDNTNKTATNDLFAFKKPINTCKIEDCEFCCLSTNHCGSKRQCDNRLVYIKYINIAFISLVSILSLAFLVKCVQTDSIPDQNNKEKIKTAALTELIQTFNIIEANKKRIMI